VWCVYRLQDSAGISARGAELKIEHGKPLVFDLGFGFAAAFNRGQASSRKNSIKKERPSG
jgi:hypothetical protein